METFLSAVNPTFKNYSSYVDELCGVGGYANTRIVFGRTTTLTRTSLVRLKLKLQYRTFNILISIKRLNPTREKRNRMIFAFNIGLGRLTKFPRKTLFANIYGIKIMILNSFLAEFPSANRLFRLECNYCGHF